MASTPLLPEPPPYPSAANQVKDRYQRPTEFLDKPDAIVIGSGIGGLGIASLLAQRKGWKVQVLEVSEVPGGCTHCHEVEGFEWNSGIDSIGDMDASVGRGMVRPTIDYITGGGVQWEKMPDVHEKAYFGEDEYLWYSSPEKNIAWINEMFRAEGVDAARYYRLEDQIEASLFGWVLTKLLPDWLPLWLRDGFYKLFGGKWRKYMKKSTNEVLVGELGYPPKLASIMSYMYGNHGETPDNSPFAFHAINLQHYKTGAYYPVGGPAHIAECAARIVENAGGQVAVKSPVKRILVEGNRAVGVELEGGETIRSPLVISDTGAWSTFMELLPREVSERHGYPQKFEGLGASVAHCYLFLGYDEEIELPKEIIWQLPAYDIPTFDRLYKQELDFDNSLGGYLLSPSARDPIYKERYPGKSTVIVLNEAPYEWVVRGQKDPEFKAKLERDLAEGLEAIAIKHFPQLEGKTPSVRLSGVPVGCNPRAWEASSMGVEPSGARFADHTHWLRPKTKIDGLYLTGQDALSMGFAGSMMASRVCYSAITGNWLFMLRKTIGTFP